MEQQPIVLKIGGSLQGKHLDVVCSAIDAAQERHSPIVLVHGGGPAISAALQERGLVAPFISGQRMTTPEAMVVVEHVLSYQINPAIVSALAEKGYPAVGVSGAENIIWAEPIPGLERTGRVRMVTPQRIRSILHDGQIPVISPVGTDIEGRTFNINADVTAASVAAALMAAKLIVLTDVPGIYSDWDAKTRLVDTCVSELCLLTESGSFQTGMIPKVHSIVTALSEGVSAAYVVQGDHPSHAADAVRHAEDVPWTGSFGTRITSVMGGITA